MINTSTWRHIYYYLHTYFRFVYFTKYWSKRIRHTHIQRMLDLVYLCHDRNILLIIPIMNKKIKKLLCNLHVI